MKNKIAKFIVLIVFSILGCIESTKAQFVDITQVEPFSDPISVCAGGTLTFRLNNLQGLNNGSIITMQMSNLGIGFNWTTCTTIAFSLDNVTYTPSANYIWNGNVANSYIRVTIPVGAPAATGYTARAVSSNPAINGNNNNGFITITPPILTIPAVPQTNYGNNQWIAHHYSWIPSVGPGTLLDNSALVNAQVFFSPSNYIGHTVQNSLSFDNDYQGNGIPGTFFDQTSIDCGNNLYSNVSIRFKRIENYAPGRYTLTIQGDDGVRLSIDGGATWILDAFIEGTFANNVRTTQTAFPNGICLSGPTEFVIEYFQRPAQARVKFSSTQVISLFNSPTNQSVCVGQNASFDATSPAPGVTYQWQISTDNGVTWTNVTNTAPYSGATTGVLTVTNVTAALNNNQYRCVVDVGCPTTLNSPSATLNVSSGTVSFSTQPTSTSACVGDNASFSAAITGSAAPTYQWWMSTDNGTTFTQVVQDATYGDPTLPTLTITGLTAAMDGYIFQCTTFGTCGGNTLTSNNATLSIGIGNPTVTAQPPLTVNACEGANTNIIAGISNSTNFIWQISTDGGVTFVDANGFAGITGQTTSTININPVQPTNDGWVFRVRLPSCIGNIFSNSCTLNVTNAAQITTQPTQPSTLCPGDNLSLSVVATDAASYSWQVNTGSGYVPIFNGSGVTGANSGSINFSPVDVAWDGATIRCQVGGNCPPASTSIEITINFDQGTTIINDPQNAIACLNQSVVFNVTANTTGISYQWQISTNGGASYTNLVEGGQFFGTLSAQLTVSNLLVANNNNQFRCIVTGVCSAPVNSQSATLTVNSNLPVINSQPVPVTICSGDTAKFFIGAGPSTVLYQWQIDAGLGFVNLINNQSYIGVQADTLKIVTAMSLNGLSFRCVIFDCGGQLISVPVILTVLEKTIIREQPQEIVVCKNQSGSFSIEAVGDGLTYQWQIKRNGVVSDISSSSLNFSGTNSPNLTLDFAEDSLDGYEVRCLIGGTCPPPLATSFAKITVSKLPEIIAQPLDVSTCTEKDVSFEISTIGTGNTYQWFTSKGPGFPFNAINTLDESDSANYSKLIVKNVDKSFEGYLYRCRVNGCGMALLSESAEIKVESTSLNLFIPNTVTPNGDSFNDIYKLVSSENITLEGNIYNRWGENVFTWKSIEDEWDGTYNGKKVAAGVYFYFISANTKCGKTEKKGTITVVY